MYESPIVIQTTLLQSSLNEELENDIMLTLKQGYNITVDKAELTRALTGHHYQYQKGYNDARNDIFDKLKNVSETEEGITLKEFLEQRWNEL